MAEGGRKCVEKCLIHAAYFYVLNIKISIKIRGIIKEAKIEMINFYAIIMPPLVNFTNFYVHIYAHTITEVTFFYMPYHL